MISGANLWSLLTKTRKFDESRTFARPVNYFPPDDSLVFKRSTKKKRFGQLLWLLLRDWLIFKKYRTQLNSPKIHL